MYVYIYTHMCILYTYMYTYIIYVHVFIGAVEDRKVCTHIYKNIIKILIFYML